MKVRALAAFVALCASGCGKVDFFEELQSADSVEEDTEAGDTDTDGSTDGDTEGQPSGDCEFPADDRCGSQDGIEQCHPDTLTFETFDCHLLCGEFVNLSCITTGSAQHACYCVEPGANKQLSCTELESCLSGCTSGACEDQCFGRTTASTIRLYGSLVFCANDDCHQVCIDNPQLCGLCIQETIAEGRGMCGLPRSVCNNDINDDPNAPWG